VLRRIISKIPIKISVPLLLTAPVLGVVVVLSLVFFSQGKTAVNDLIEQNLTQIHDRINKRIDEQLKMTVRITLINANLIERGKLDTSRMNELGMTFFEQLQALDMLSAVAWGGEDGRAAWIARSLNQTDYELTIKDDPADGKIQKYRLDARGQIRSRQTVEADYDPRLQPWYQTAVTADAPTWSELFSGVYKNNSESALSIAFVRPLRNLVGERMGVISAELSLQDLSQILEKLRVGKTGRAFLMDRKGRLLASSTGTPVTDTEHHQLDVAASYDRHIATAARYLEAAFGSFEDIGTPNQIRLAVDGEPYILMVSPARQDTGLTWIIGTLVPESDFMAEIDNWRRHSIKIGAVAIAITLLLGIAFAAISLRPMLDLIAFVRKVGEGDLERELKLDYATEFVQLSKEINAMTAGLKDRIQCRHTLALAMEVQQNLLPQKAPQVEGIDIAGTVIYCDETGGDYYDYLDIGRNNGRKFGVVVGDVSDHGIQSALLMVSARALIRQHAQHSDDIAKIVAEVNWHLSRDLRESGHFMTLFLGEFDVSQKLFQWVRAGHDPGIFYDINRDSFEALAGEGLPLGVFENSAYQVSQMPVAAGQIFFIGTDGIWETRNARGEKFGKNAVKKVIRSRAHRSAKKIRNALVDELEKFRHNSRREDDVTMVVIKIEEGF